MFSIEGGHMHGLNIKMTLGSSGIL